MQLVKNVCEKIMLLNEPQLVARFQRWCNIDISCADSGFSTAVSETTDSPPSDDHLNFNLEDDNDCQNSIKNGTITNGNAVGEPLVGDTCLNNDSGLKNRTKKANDEKEMKNLVANGVEKYVFGCSMENNVSFKIRNQFLYFIFCLGSELGNETFLCYFFPYWVWNIDGYVCRRITLIWALTLYIGQATKDLIQWPRPTSPPVAKLEKRYELEYGMPSTHAMVGFAIPFSILVLTMERYIYSWPIMVGLCTVWCALVCLSRAYLGMHSFLDILCGLIFSIILTPIFFLFIGEVDRFQLTHPYAPFVMVSVTLLLAICYPTLDKWSTCRGDTTLVLGVTAGFAIASWVANHQGLYEQPTTPPPYYVKIPDTEFVLTTLVRMVLGGTILMATRTTMKFTMLRSLCRAYGIPHDDVKSRQLLKVELPYKYVTYLVVAFNVVYTAPLVFKYLGVSRVTNFTDL